MRPLILSLALLSVAAAASAAPALTPQSLRPAMTQEEQEYYDTIKNDPKTAQNFLITRDYVRKAQAVKSGKMSPLSFPSQRPAGFSVDYLLPDDPGVINDALGMYLSAKLAAGGNPWAIA